MYWLSNRNLKNTCIGYQIETYKIDFTIMNIYYFVYVIEMVIKIMPCLLCKLCKKMMTKKVTKKVTKKLRQKNDDKLNLKSYLFKH